MTLWQVTKELGKIDLDDILSCWHWRLGNVKDVVMVTVLGDLFLSSQDQAIHWLQTDSGNLTKVAENMQEFQRLLVNEEKFDTWFLPILIKKLIESGKLLNDNEVYSYKTIPVLGGEYSVENIEPTDISVHFAISGQICQQINDLPDGTKVNINART